MPKTTLLVLADGSTYEGFSFGVETDAIGETVFNTSMAGYQEMLTDPSYAGQILIPTYPLIGNYGTNAEDDESRRIQVKGFVVREECDLPSHYLKNKTIHEYLTAGGIPGIWGVDTRAITRRLRSSGVMMGMITSSKTPAQALKEIKKAPDYGDIDFVKGVTTDKQYEWKDGDKALYHVVALDCGLKYNILRLLAGHGCRTTIVPCTTSAEEILKLKPDGILLSPGPGDPDKLDYLVATVQKLVGKKPIMGICLGNQLIHRAFGGKHFKLKFGHRGGNHPVRDLATGRVYITAQNHGYAADPSTVSKELEVTHINLNDGTVEGLKHKELPLFAIQYHSEASPGPLDNVYLFEKFVGMMEESNK
ncbi:MAG: glutamine-hydrolyzing carbamoyl-phosphate synthase small subunit [Dehalococcoidales bacterium]|jgi:carbamoyl-phosphate synthase small subunit